MNDVMERWIRQTDLKLIEAIRGRCQMEFRLC